MVDAMSSEVNAEKMLKVALREARAGLAEGGIPIGAAIFAADGRLVASGHNRRVQDGDPSAHGETDAFRRAGRQRSWRDLIMVTTLAPCWYCSGLIRQFGFRKVVVGESRTFQGGIGWLREQGIEIVDLDSQECAGLLGGFIAEHPEVRRPGEASGEVCQSRHHDCRGCAVTIITDNPSLRMQPVLYPRVA
jgi:creatinine deaminase